MQYTLSFAMVGTTFAAVVICVQNVVRT
jgi:hypothetical protein